MKILSLFSLPPDVSKHNFFFMSEKHLFFVHSMKVFNVVLHPYDFHCESKKIFWVPQKKVMRVWNDRSVCK